MPELLGQAKRGRKPEALRVTIQQLAKKLTAGIKATTVDVVVVAPKTPKGKPQILRGVEIPKGALMVPFELTDGKSFDSAKETIKNGLKDAKVSAKVGAQRYRDDDKKEGAIFYIELKPVEK